MHASELWEDPGVGPTLARLALSPLSLIYAIGWEAYLGVYRLGIKKAAHPHSPIVCVGNLVSGGSGKTPITLHLVQVLRELGNEVVVSSSGYGSPKSDAASVAPDGDLDARTWGDEAALFRHTYPDLPLIVGRRRVLAAQLAGESFPGAVLMLDDGFQHLPLKKDLTILLDPERPLNRMCLPAGPYREPRWNRKRADLVLPGNFQVVESTQLTLPNGTPAPTPETTNLLCAVGKPQNVASALEGHGVLIQTKLFMPDHDPLAGGTLLGTLPSEIPTVVTAKDWVKLRNRTDLGGRQFLILDHKARIEPRDMFKDWLQRHLHVIQEANLPR